MAKEMATAGEIVKADAGGGFQSYKETVYHFLENSLTWLSTHQGLALVLILIVLGIMIYLILKIRKSNRQIQNQAAAQKLEIGKKDKQIEDQKNQLEALQKKLSDQQTVASEAMLKTIMTMTGYDIGQLQIFFKFLTEISGNPLQIANTQASAIPARLQLAEGTDGPAEEKIGEDQVTPGAGPQEAADADTDAKFAAAATPPDEKIAADAGPQEVAETPEDEKIAADAGPQDVADTDRDEKRVAEADPQEVAEADGDEKIVDDESPQEVAGADKREKE